MVKVFLITANVGSVFENLEGGLKTWMNEIISSVNAHNPQFVGIHFQETGGKGYKNGSNVIDIFFRALVDNFTSIGLRLAEGFIDSDAEVESEFTALANVYFIRENLNEVHIWDFQDKKYVPVLPQQTRLHSGKDLPLAKRMHKEKFPQHFFPNSIWSRKGFLRTRWNIQGTEIELINIHLFHDSSNITASSESPSPFAQNRRKTLNYVLEKIQTEGPAHLARFIFGDFNFRVNTYEVYNILRKDSQDTTEPFQVDAKKFVVNNHEQRFKSDYHWLRRYDFEASQFGPVLGEFDVNFHPTYPFDESLPDKFLRTRCPAWCDRVLFTQNTLSSISKEFPTEYNLIGGSVCMGDHKPVYLSFELETKRQLGNSVNDISSVHSAKDKCGVVSFFLSNLGFNQRRNINSNSPKRNVNSTGKCCFQSSVNSTNNSAFSLGSQSLSNTNNTKTVQQNILILKDNESLDEIKDDYSVVKPIFILNRETLKDHSNEKAIKSQLKSIKSANNRASTNQPKCCGCTIM